VATDGPTTAGNETTDTGATVRRLPRHHLPHPPSETDAEEHTLRKLSDALGLALPELSGTTPQEAPSSPAAARSLAGPTPEALAARLAFLRDQFRAYQQLGQLPSQEVLAEWIRLTADIKEQDDD
jgi:hypothetical protein